MGVKVWVDYMTIAIEGLIPILDSEQLTQRS